MMFEIVIKKMVSYGVIENEDSEIYLYGLKSMFLYVLYFTFSILSAILMKQMYIYVLFVFLGIGLRRNMGGVHLTKVYSCFLMSLIYTFVPLWLCSRRIISSGKDLYVCAIVLDLLTIVLTVRFGVVKHKNKIYTEFLIKKSKRNAIIIEIVIAFISVGALLFQKKNILLLIVYILLTQILSFGLAVQKR